MILFLSSFLYDVLWAGRCNILQRFVFGWTSFTVGQFGNQNTHIHKKTGLHSEGPNYLWMGAFYSESTRRHRVCFSLSYMNQCSGEQEGSCQDRWQLLFCWNARWSTGQILPPAEMTTMILMFKTHEAGCPIIIWFQVSDMLLLLHEITRLAK